jgi:putative spermidine/putrescine transport system ATP-binding protein
LSASTALAVEGLVKRYGALAALDGASLEVGAGDLLTILGPSGSGKTTLLKAVAGFETPDSGVIRLDGQDITRTTPAARDIGMVFQNYALFPHMTVAANIAFPLRMRGWKREAIDERVAWALRLVELPDHGTRLPPQLSGGQQQRVALARAVVFNPKLLLLDEPFGALDRKLREAMQLEVRRLQRKLGLTTIFITHDQEEALILSDRVAVMRDGRIQQVGAPRDLYRQPQSRFVAEFVGESNLLRGRVVAADNAAMRVQIADGLTLAAPQSGAKPGDEIVMLLRPEVPLPATAASENRLTARIVETVYLGNAVKYRLAAPSGLELIVRWPVRPQDAPLAPGAELALGWSAADMHVLP